MNRFRQATPWAIVFSLVYPSLLTLVYFVLLREHPAALQQSVFAVGKVVQFGFPLAWYCLIQQQQTVWRAPTAKGLETGLAFGALVLVATLALYYLVLEPMGVFLGDPTEAVRQKVVGFGIDRTWKFVLLAVLYSLAHSLLEEYYWRWFVFGQLRQLTSFPVAVVVSSLGFMAHHVLVLGVYFGWLSPATILFSLAVGLGGAVWAWLYERTGALYAPWVSHLLVDAGIFVVGYDLVRDVLR